MRRTLQQRITELEYRVEKLEHWAEREQGPAVQKGDRLRERVRYHERLVDQTRSCLSNPEFRHGGVKAVPGWEQELLGRQAALDKAKARLKEFEERAGRRAQHQRFLANCLAAAP